MERRVEGDQKPTIGLFHWKCQPSRRGTVRLGRDTFVKSQGTKWVWKIVWNPVTRAMKQCDMGQNIHMPNGRNAISNKGQQATGKLYNADHVRTSQTETQGFQFILFRVCIEDLFVWKKQKQHLFRHKRQWFQGLPKQSASWNTFPINNQDNRLYGSLAQPH